MKPELKEALDYVAEHVDKQIGLLIPKSKEPEERLFEAMRYGTLQGGKRVRAFLVMMSAGLFGVDEVRAFRVAAAVECVHSYSLIHDDLPCMDDATLRRGHPAMHREYDEATAVLAGDALQSLAFEILAHEDTHRDPRIRIKLIAGMATAIGPAGMAGGQMLDLLGENQEMSLGQVARMNRMKTGALIRYACETGAIMGQASPQHMMALRNFIADIGQVYQITDDLLDHQGARQDTGKDTKQDAKAGKSNYVRYLGPEETQKKARLLVEQAIGHLKPLKDREGAQRMIDLAEYLLERKR